MARATTIQKDESVASVQPVQPRRLKKVAFWIPIISDETAVQRKKSRPNDWWDVNKWGWDIVNPNGAHRTYVHGREIQFVAGVYHTDNPNDVAVLLTDPIAKCRRADIVVAGIYTLSEMQSKGYLKRPDEIEECRRLCAEAGVDPETKSDEARKMAEVVLYALPDFDRMSREEVLTWASDDSASGKLMRGTAQIPLSLSATKDEMVRNIRATLVERGDPRQW